LKIGRLFSQVRGCRVISVGHSPRNPSIDTISRLNLAA
jgi:hypothetical protein